MGGTSERGGGACLTLKDLQHAERQLRRLLRRAHRPLTPAAIEGLVDGLGLRAVWEA